MMVRPARRSANVGLSVGTSSILVIFVLLCLTTFATLSLVSANADYRLPRRAAETASAYYEADARAEELLAGVVAELAEIRGTAPEGEYLSLAARSLSAGVAAGLEASGESAAAGQISPPAAELSPDGRAFLSYSVPIGETQELAVRLEILPPTEAGYVKRLEWRVKNLPDVNPMDEAINGLWAGEDAVLPLA